MLKLTKNKQTDQYQWYIKNNDILQLYVSSFKVKTYSSILKEIVKIKAGQVKNKTNDLKLSLGKN